MAAVALSARFPLGTFLGHDSVGRPSPFPDTARLFSALVHAAGKGSLAIEQAGDLRIAPEVAGALLWLETNPPSALAQPEAVLVGGSQETPAHAWRDEGVDEKSRGGYARRRVAKPQSDAVAINGAWAWVWDQDVPDSLVSIIDQLCADVSCLGESDAPVVLEVVDVSEVQITHLRDLRESAFPQRGDLEVRTPTVGRLDALESDYALARPVKVPTVGTDRHSWGQQPRSHRPATAGLLDVTYRPVTKEAPLVPWDHAHVLIPHRSIDASERVRWCVALHRAIAARLDDDHAPPSVTGKYAAGSRQPANRVAVQFLSASDLTTISQSAAAALDDTSAGVFLVMVPRDISESDAEQLAQAVARVTTVFWRGRFDVRLTSSGSVDLVDFWSGSPVGCRRWWAPTPGLIPESRRPRNKRWALADAALLSIGYLLRDRFPAYGGPDRLSRLTASVRESGAQVHGARLIPDSRLERFVHKVGDGVVVQPYTAFVDFGELLPETTLVSLGQSRHLGGGLLLPVDMPESAAMSLAQGAR